MSPFPLLVLSLLVVVPFGASAQETGFGPRYPEYPSYPNAQQPSPSPQGDASSLVTTVGLEGQGHPMGVTLGVNALFEGPQWGVGAQYQAIVSGAGPDLRSVQLAQLNLNYAIIASPVLRLRLEGGGGFAKLGDVRVYAPMVGVSGAFGQLGAVQLEGSLRISPLPLLQADYSFGGAIAVGNMGIRAGYKRVFLGSFGAPSALDGDVFSGAYLGLGWSL